MVRIWLCPSSEHELALARATFAYHGERLTRLDRQVNTVDRIDRAIRTAHVKIDARVKCTFRRRGDVMNTKIADLMAKRVITAQPHHSIEHVRGLMQRNRIHSVPVVGPENVALGIVTSADLAADLKAATPVQHVMSGPVHSVPAYNDVSVAARIMRKNKVHHVVVTHEKRVVGLISSFDLLKLVEGRRFVSKQGPSDNKHSGANKRGSTNEG